MTPESFYHVPAKVADVDAAAFYRNALGGTVVERTNADGKTGGQAVEYAAMAVAEILVYAFDRPSYGAAGLVDPLRPGSSTSASSTTRSRHCRVTTSRWSWTRPSSAT